MVGIREVAAEAGVSVATVSNVLNKPEAVSDATKQKVVTAMAELGFIRNELARQLKMGGGTTLGMIVLNASNPFFADLTHACEAIAEEVGHTIIFGSSDQSLARENRYIDLFAELRVSGLLVVSTNGATPAIDQLARRGVPIVLFDHTIHSGEYCSVAADGVVGGYDAVSHLLRKGRRRVAFVGGPMAQVQDRWLGAQRAVEHHGSATLSFWNTADQTVVDGHAIGVKISRMAPMERPDAVFAANDLLALGVLQALVRSEGLHVPADVAIVGYDGIEYGSSAVVPLTTVEQPTEQLARQAIDLVLDHSRSPQDHVHRHVLVPPVLQVRSTT